MMLMSLFRLRALSVMNTFAASSGSTVARMRARTMPAALSVCSSVALALYAQIAHVAGRLNARFLPPRR